MHQYLVLGQSNYKSKCAVNELKPTRYFQTKQLVLNYAYVQITYGRNTIFMLHNVMTITARVPYLHMQILRSHYPVALYLLLSTRRSHTIICTGNATFSWKECWKDAHIYTIFLTHKQTGVCHNGKVEGCLPQSTYDKHPSNPPSKGCVLRWHSNKTPNYEH